MSLLAPALVLSLLAWAVVTDVRERRIPNVIPAGIAFLCLVQVVLADGPLPRWPALAPILIAFAAAMAAWKSGWVGGGDVKLLGALALWTGPAKLMDLLLLSSLLGGALAVLWLHLLKVSAFLPAFLSDVVHGPTPGAGMRPTLPYGPAIALAGAWLVHERYWL